MIDAYKKFWNGYVDFTGHSTRSDYWWSVLCNILVMLLLVSPIPVIETALNSEIEEALSTILAALVIIYFILILLPYFAIQVRRLRDAGFHWALIFLSIVPLGLGRLILIILYCQPTKYKPIINNQNYQNQPQPQQNFASPENEQSPFE